MEIPCWHTGCPWDLLRSNTQDEGSKNRHYLDLVVHFSLYPSGQTPSQLTQPALVGGRFQFNLTGSSLHTYRVEMTTTPSNPASWVPVMTNTPFGGSFLFWDSNIASAARFYRTVVLQ